MHVLISHNSYFHSAGVLLTKHIGAVAGGTRPRQAQWPDTIGPVELDPDRQWPDTMGPVDLDPDRYSGQTPWGQLN